MRSFREGDPLSPREEQALALLVEEHGAERMAELLFVSESTVKSMLAHIYAKLGVRGRVGAALWWERRRVTEKLRRAVAKAAERALRESLEG